MADNMIYDIETNFYCGGGSKINETARIYKMLSQEDNIIDEFTFVWFMMELARIVQEVIWERHSRLWIRFTVLMMWRMWLLKKYLNRRMKYMSDKDRVIELIECGQETDFCDFKREFYHFTKKGDMLKDIVSFANSLVFGNKYIIFNIDDKTHQVCEMNMDTIPDISEINALLREYCEPHIGIEMCVFSYQKASIAYIKIPEDCTDRPYLIKKDFVRDGKVLLHQGQIFLRRNSDNFRANRRDLDEIYESRTKRKVYICKNEIVEKEIVVKNVVKRIFSLDFVFDNNAKDNYLIEEIKIVFKQPEHCFSTKVKNVTSINVQSTYQNDKMTDMPFSVEALTTVQKRLQFELSSTCIEQIRKNGNDENEFAVFIEVQDVKKRKVCSEIINCTFKFIK